MNSTLQSDDGVTCGTNCLLKGATISSDNTAVSFADGSSLVESTVRQNEPVEPILRVESGTARYSDTIFTIDDGAAPFFFGNAIDMGGNVCDGTPGCP